MPTCSSARDVEGQKKKWILSSVAHGSAWKISDSSETRLPWLVCKCKDLELEIGMVFPHGVRLSSVNEKSEAEGRQKNGHLIWSCKLQAERS